jgi:hypothetical protein
MVEELLSISKILGSIPSNTHTHTHTHTLSKEVKDQHPENWKRKLKMTQINGKIIHVNNLEDLILLKCPY